MLLTVSFALATVFATAGVGKLRDRDGSRAAARAFGTPAGLAGAVAFGLPLAEIAIAVLLLPATTRWWAAAAGLGLLLVFCAAIGRAMARGEAPECHCFGQLHSAPAGWSTLGRNGFLAVIAAFVFAACPGGAGPSAFAWVSSLDDGIAWLVLGLSIALVAVVAIGGYAVWHVLRSYGRVLVRLGGVEERLRAAGFDLEDPEDVPQLGLEPGMPAPGFTLTSSDGERVGLADLAAAGNPVLLLFTSPTCGPCALLMPAVATWQREHAHELTIALVSGGDADAVGAEADKHELANVLLDTDLAVYEAYEANGTPSAVLVGEDGTVAAWLAAGSDWIETLVEQALSGAGRTPGLPLGSDAPVTRLQTLAGRRASVDELVERPTVALFWSPGCGFCRSLHDDVLAWEAARPAESPDLLVVSSGEVRDVRAEGFTSAVLLDPEWQLSSEFGADGTPMAVLLDENGRIASPLVTGGPAVLELLVAGELAAAR
jgi:thiol-disulfide isomerase/thioredoxin